MTCSPERIGHPPLQVIPLHDILTNSLTLSPNIYDNEDVTGHKTYHHKVHREMEQVDIGYL